MRNGLRAAAVAAALATCLAIPLIASAGTGITGTLDASSVVNPNGGDPNGSGTVAMRVNRVRQRICFTITYKGLHNVTGSFLHKGDPGEIARPILTLFEGNQKSPVRSCIKGVRKRIVKRLKRKPDQHYVDIDTKKFPDGALRGQLHD